MLTPDAPADQLSDVFAALADPTRRAILHRLTLGDARVGELAEPFAMSQPAVSKHLKVLDGAGLISRTQVATSRFSHLEAEPLKEATEYMEKYRRFWNSSFDKLDEALASFTRATGPAGTARSTDTKHTPEPPSVTDENEANEENKERSDD
jgi:DNA-binding transcriptional ArsR family regulator